MSDSRELPNITGFDTSLFLCVFLSFLRIQQVPKTATEPSPICQALRSARRLGHPSFVLYFYFAYQRTLLLCARAAGSKLMPTNWKKKTSSHSVLNFLKTLISPPNCSRQRSILPWTALFRGRQNAQSESSVRDCASPLLRVVVSCSNKTHRAATTSRKRVDFFFCPHRV